MASGEAETALCQLAPVAPRLTVHHWWGGFFFFPVSLWFGFAIRAHFQINWWTSSYRFEQQIQPESSKIVFVVRAEGFVIELICKVSLHFRTCPLCYAMVYRVFSPEILWHSVRGCEVLSQWWQKASVFLGFCFQSVIKTSLNLESSGLLIMVFPFHLYSGLHFSWKVIYWKNLELGTFSK